MQQMLFLDHHQILSHYLHKIKFIDGYILFDLQQISSQKQNFRKFNVLKLQGNPLHQVIFKGSYVSSNEIDICDVDLNSNL